MHRLTLETVAGYLKMGAQVKSWHDKLCFSLLYNCIFPVWPSVFLFQFQCQIDALIRKVWHKKLKGSVHFEIIISFLSSNFFYHLLIELDDLVSKINSLMFGSFIVFHFKDWSGKNGELLCYLLKHEYWDCFSVFLHFFPSHSPIRKNWNWWFFDPVEFFFVPFREEVKYCFADFVIKIG